MSSVWIRRHFDGIVVATQTRETNGFIEAINGLFRRQSATLVDMRALRLCAQSSSSSLEIRLLPLQ